MYTGGFSKENVLVLEIDGGKRARVLELGRTLLKEEGMSGFWAVCDGEVQSSQAPVKDL